MVTREPLPKGRHEVALACKELTGNVRIDVPDDRRDRDQLALNGCDPDSQRSANYGENEAGPGVFMYPEAPIRE